MLIYDQETFLVIINVENSRAAQYFSRKCDAFPIKILWEVKQIYFYS